MPSLARQAAGIARFSLLVAGLGWSALAPGACSPRPVVCDGVAGCGAGTYCVAHACLPEGGEPVPPTSRRLVLPAAAVAFIQRGNNVPAGTLVSPATLGRAKDGPSAVLLRFEVPREADVLAAYLLIERGDETPPVDGAGGVALHPERIEEPWDPATVDWLHGPALHDVRAPSLLLRAGSPRLLRIPLGALLHGAAREVLGPRGTFDVALVADRFTPSGASLALAPPPYGPLIGDGPTAGAGARGTGAAVDPEPAGAPRLELYVK